MIDFAAIRARQAKGEPDGRAIGVGLCVLHRAERPRHHRMGQAQVARGAGLRVGQRAACCRTARVIIHVGMQNHGQGHETTLAQIAAHELAHRSRADLGALRRHRDRRRSASAPSRSRSIVFARRRGGAHLPHAARKNPAHRRASAADRRRQHASRGRRGARAVRRGQLRRDRLRGQRAPGASAGRHGPAARRDRDLRADRDRRRVRLRHPCRAWSRSSPTPA